MGRHDLSPRRHARRRHRDHAEVPRVTTAHGGRRRLARHRPGPAAARRPGHGQDVGQRAPRGRRQRLVDPHRAGHGRHARGVAALRLELRAAARRGADARRARAEPGDAGHGDRHPRAHRGADAHPGRRPGRAHHDPVGEAPADPRARLGGAGAAGLQRHRHRQQPRQGGQRPVVGAQAPLQHRRAAAARHPGAGGRDRPHPGRLRSAARSSCRPGSSRSPRSSASSRSSASCAPGSPPTSAPRSSRRRRPCRPPRRSRS